MSDDQNLMEVTQSHDFDNICQSELPPFGILAK